MTKIFRPADQTVVVTYIRNNGVSKVAIYEDGIIIAIVQPGEIVRLAERGAGELSVDYDPINGTSITAITERRSLCGDLPPPPAPNPPSGSFLL